LLVEDQLVAAGPNSGAEIVEMPDPMLRSRDLRLLQLPQGKRPSKVSAMVNFA
jgi:hypothetical protein